MGLFKDFKEDFSQAVNELAPGEEEAKLNETTARKTVNTLGQDVDVKTELSKLDGLLEQVKEEPVERPVARPVMPQMPQMPQMSQMAVTEPDSTMTMKEESRVMSDIPVNETLNTQAVAPQPMVSDETSVITQGTALTGDMQTTGSLDIQERSMVMLHVMESWLLLERSMVTAVHQNFLLMRLRSRVK